MSTRGTGCESGVQLVTPIRKSTYDVPSSVDIVLTALDTEIRITVLARSNMLVVRSSCYCSVDVPSVSSIVWRCAPAYFGNSLCPGPVTPPSRLTRCETPNHVVVRANNAVISHGRDAKPRQCSPWRILVWAGVDLRLCICVIANLGHDFKSVRAYINPDSSQCRFCNRR